MTLEPSQTSDISDIQSLILEIEPTLYAKSTKENINSIEEQLIPLAIGENGILTRPECRTLSNVLVAAYMHHSYQDRKFLSSLEDMISLCSESPSIPFFRQTCTVVLDSAINQCSNIAALAAFQIGCILLSAHIKDQLFSEKNNDNEESKEVNNNTAWVEKTILLLSNLFERLYPFTDLYNQAKHNFLQVFHLKPSTVISVIMSVIYPQHIRTSLALFSIIVTSLCSDTQSPDFIQWKPILMNIYNTEVLNNKTGTADPKVLQTFYPFLSTITVEEFNTSFLPVIEKLLKKNPEMCFEMVIKILSGLNIDLSASVDVFLPAIIRQLKSAKDNMRELSLQMLEIFSQRCKENTAIFSRIVNELCDTLQGKNGLLAQWYQKHCLITALKLVLPAGHLLPQDILEPLASNVVNVVLTFTNESHDVTRRVAISGAAEWQTKCRSVTNNFIESNIQGIENKNPLICFEFLQALSFLCRHNNNLWAQLSPLVPILEKIISNLTRSQSTNKKPQIEIINEGILALDILSSILASGSNSDKKLEQLLTVLQNPQLCIYAETDLYTLDPLIFSSIMLSFTSLVVKIAKYFPHLLIPNILSNTYSLHDNPHPLFLILVRALVLTQQNNKKEICCHIQELIQLHRDIFCVIFIKAFWIIFHQLCRKITSSKEKQKIASNISDETTEISTGTVTELQPSVLTNAYTSILTLIQSNKVSPLEGIPICFILSHHPMISSSLKVSINLWKKTIACFGGFTEVEKIFQNQEIVSNVVDTSLDACFSLNSLDQEAGRRAILSLSKFGNHGCELFMTEIIPQLLSNLRIEEINSITQQEIAIYCAPEGVLFRSIEEFSGAQNHSTSIHHLKKQQRSGRRQKLYNIEDQLWEQQVRQEIEMKKSQAAEKPVTTKPNAKKDGTKVKDGSKPKAKESKENKETSFEETEQIMLQEENAIRAKISDLKHYLQSSVAVFVFMCNHNLEHGLSPCVQLLPIFHHLLKNSLFHDTIFSAVQVYATHIAKFDDFSQISVTLASAFRLSSVTKDLNEKNLPFSVVKVLDTISSKLKSSLTQKLSFYSFSILFPILQPILTSQEPPKGLENAYIIFSVYCSMFQSSNHHLDEAALYLLRSQMLTAVLRVAVKYPNMKPSPESLLISLCAGLPVVENEWNILLGEVGLLSTSHVRLMCLNGIMTILSQGNYNQQFFNESEFISSRLWFARNDTDSNNAQIAQQIWNQRGIPLTLNFAPLLLNITQLNIRDVNEIIALSIGQGLLLYPSIITDTVSNLETFFGQNVPPPLPTSNSSAPTIKLSGTSKKQQQKVLAEFFKEDEPKKKEWRDDGWPVRVAVSRIFEEFGHTRCIIDNSLKGVILPRMLTFLIRYGLGDLNDAVYEQAISACKSLIDGYKENVSQFVNLFDDIVKNSLKIERESVDQTDQRRAGIAILMGFSGKHLDKTDPKIKSIINALSETLNVPSEPVQRATASCLGTLVKAVKTEDSQIGNLLDQLLERCLKAKSYGERRGGAFGLAAVVKGLGITSLKQHNVIPKLQEAAEKGSLHSKQGVMFAVEILCEQLGILFEPYVIAILPLLLKLFSDSSEDVRVAAKDASRVVMANLSGHGVKLVLQPILKSLNDSAWRTKAGSAELLGAMAFCAPKQLANCLPQVIPQLLQTLSDTHPEVKSSAAQALRDIASVIRNPEISQLSHVLLGALMDPSNNTLNALDTLLSCEFLHVIDPPSLALIVPVMQRGLRDRSTTTKRKASLIMGSICAMVGDPKDLLPYFSTVLPILLSVLMDPIPDVRTTAAKALGSLAQGVGEAPLHEVVPKLISNMKICLNSAERSGNAQGLAYVIGALGDARIKEVLDEVLPLVNHPKFEVREGVFWLLTFLPHSIGDSFVDYLEMSLPTILSGLSDDSEQVRSVSMRAGQTIVTLYGKANIRLLLPTLEFGLTNENWRIRHSSIQLLGDLLMLISDTKKNDQNNVDLNDTTEEDVVSPMSAEQISSKIKNIIGKEQYSRIFALLYILRSDTSAIVRQCALQIWKVVVQNTPKLLKEVMPYLIHEIVVALGSGSIDKQIVAGKTLGDLVQKLGHQVIPDAVPFLRQNLTKEEEQLRQGACLGLAEIMRCASKKQLTGHLEDIVNALQQALVDTSSVVREQAAQAFEALYKLVGPKSVDEIISPLIDLLASNDPDIHDRAVGGLKEVIYIRPKEILAFIIPNLIVSPISIKSAQTLKALAQNASDHIYVQYQTIIPALTKDIIRIQTKYRLQDIDTPFENETKHDETTRTNINQRQALLDSLEGIVISVEEDGLQRMMNEISKQFEVVDDIQAKRIGLWMIEKFCQDADVNYDSFIPILLKNITSCMNDAEPQICSGVLNTFSALFGSLKIDQLAKNIRFMRTCITSLISDSRRKKGGVGDGDLFLTSLNSPKAWQPFEIFQNLIQHGEQTIREETALLITDLMEVTKSEYLQPYLFKLIGAIIRIINHQNTSNVQLAILQAITKAFEKGGIALRPFLPQLQGCFVKNLQDPSKGVREQTAKAFTLLVGLSPRIDSAINELIKSTINQAASPLLLQSMLQTLVGVLSSSSDKVSPAIAQKALNELSGSVVINHPDDGIRSLCGTVIGLTLRSADQTTFDDFIENLLSSSQSSSNSLHTQLIALAILLKFSDTKVIARYHDVISIVENNLLNPQTVMRCASCIVLSNAIDCIYYSIGENALRETVTRLAVLISAMFQDSSADVRKYVVTIVKTIAKRSSAISRDNLLNFVPGLFMCVKDPNMRVKMAADRSLARTLQVHTRPQTIEEFVKLADPQTGIMVRDYARRVLSKLNQDSGDEGENVLDEFLAVNSKIVS